MSCKVRVWDNGDMTDCGKASHRPGSQYCSDHHKQRLESVSEAIEHARNQIVVLTLLKDDLRRA